MFIPILCSLLMLTAILAGFYGFREEWLKEKANKLLQFEIWDSQVEPGDGWVAETVGTTGNHALNTDKLYSNGQLPIEKSPEKLLAHLKNLRRQRVSIDKEIERCEAQLFEQSELAV